MIEGPYAAMALQLINMEHKVITWHDTYSYATLVSTFIRHYSLLLQNTEMVLPGLDGRIEQAFRKPSQLELLN